MDVRGPSRLRNGLARLFQIASPQDGEVLDRDPDGRRHAKKDEPNITLLSREQEDAALESLRQSLSKGQGHLRAEVHRSEQTEKTYIVVKDEQNNLLRQLNYPEIIKLYLERRSDNPKGQLLKSSA